MSVSKGSTRARFGAAAAIAGLAMAPALVVLATSQSWAAGCSVYAETPSPGTNGNIGGHGGRTGCSSSTTVYVDLKWDRPLLPDPVIDGSSGSFKNVSLLVVGDCLPGTHDYYIRTHTSGGSDVSSDPRRKAACFLG